MHALRRRVVMAEDTRLVGLYTIPLHGSTTAQTLERITFEQVRSTRLHGVHGVYDGEGAEPGPHTERAIAVPPRSNLMGSFVFRDRCRRQTAPCPRTSTRRLLPIVGAW
jgi:hypothetical protein